MWSMSKSKALSFLLAAALLTACQGGAKSQELISGELMLPEQANYHTTQVLSGRYEKTSQGSASLLYPISADLFGEEDGARLREILVSSGDQVKKGDVLAVFEIESSDAELAGLRLQLQRKEEELAQGSKEHQDGIKAIERRLPGLISHEKQIAKLKLEKAQAAYELFVYQTETEIGQLREKLAEAEETVQDNVLTAPFDGVISSVIIYHSGDRVEPGETIISLYSTEQLLLKVSESSEKLRYNMEVTVEAGRKNERQAFRGRVIAAPGILPSQVPMNYALIQPDEGVTAEDLKYSIQYTCVAEEAYDAVLVDRKAVQKENGKNFVYLLEDDIAKKRFVAAGSSNLEQTWILDGLTPGQTLILD